jgi:hypothetical protein
MRCDECKSRTEECTYWAQHRTAWHHLMMISEMPTTPCLSTSSATEKALCSGVFSGMICSSLNAEEVGHKGIDGHIRGGDSI